MTTHEVNGDVRRRLARLESALQDVRDRLAKLENVPRPQMQGYSRSGPALDWQDGTRTYPKGEDDA